MVVGGGGGERASPVVPSDLNVPGNDGADVWADPGRQQHPNNLLLLPKRRQVTEWDRLWRVLMPPPEVPDASSDVDSGCGPQVLTSCPWWMVRGSVRMPVTHGGWGSQTYIQTVMVSAQT